jgi:hypothetical protein
MEPCFEPGQTLPLACRSSDRGNSLPYRNRANVLSKFTSHNRESAFLIQRGRCFYRHFPMWRRIAERNAIIAELGLTGKQVRRLKCTAEHLIPRAECGSNRTDNIAAARNFCNTKQRFVGWPTDGGFVVSSRRIRTISSRDRKPNALRHQNSSEFQYCWKEYRFFHS